MSEKPAISATTSTFAKECHHATILTSNREIPDVCLDCLEIYLRHEMQMLKRSLIDNSQNAIGPKVPRRKVESAETKQRAAKDYTSIYNRYMSFESEPAHQILPTKPKWPRPDEVVAFVVRQANIEEQQKPA